MVDSLLTAPAGKRRASLRKAARGANFKETMPAASDVVVVVDPYSTGGCFPPFLSARGFAVIALWTLECGDQAEHVPEECAEWKVTS